MKSVLQLEKKLKRERGQSEREALQAQVGELANTALDPDHPLLYAMYSRAHALELIEGTGWDIGQGVRFLLSNHARYITGQVLVIDGGVTLQGPERDSQAQ